MSETHTAPSRVTERISHIENLESKAPARVQTSERYPRTSFDTIKSSTTRTTESFPASQISTDVIIKDKRIISSVDSDLSGSSPPIYQSTPKSTKQNLDDDAGHESEDELSDPANRLQQQQQQQLQYDIRRRTPKTRLRDFSQATSQTIDDTTFANQRTKSSFDETNMENILSHVPASKG